MREELIEPGFTGGVRGIFRMRVMISLLDSGSGGGMVSW
jgi:hypothetical protein